MLLYFYLTVVNPVKDKMKVLFEWFLRNIEPVERLNPEKVSFIIVCLPNNGLGCGR